MNFLDNLKEHEERLKPRAMACVLSEILKETVKIEPNIDLFNGELLCCLPENSTDTIYLYPLEITNKKIEGEYKRFYSKSNPDSETIYILEKIGMSFRETDRSKDGTINGEFILS